MAYMLKNSNGVATFTIDRPAYRNAVNFEVMEGLESFLTKVETDASISFAVIRGAGEKAFCSGGDLSEFHSLRTANDAYPMLERMTKNLYRLSVLPVPVVALVNGTAVGGGCEIASACDYRLVSKNAKAGFIQGTLAITSGWGGATQLIEKLKQRDQLMKFLGEASVLAADELLAIGWATDLYEGSAEEGISRFLSKMTAIHPSVHRAYKSLFIRSFEEYDIKEKMLQEAKRCAELWESEAHHLAVSSFLSRKR